MVIVHPSAAACMHACRYARELWGGCGGTPTSAYDVAADVDMRTVSLAIIPPMMARKGKQPSMTKVMSHLAAGNSSGSGSGRRRCRRAGAGMTGRGDHRQSIACVGAQRFDPCAAVVRVRRPSGCQRTPAFAHPSVYNASAVAKGSYACHLRLLGLKAPTVCTTLASPPAAAPGTSACMRAVADKGAPPPPPPTHTPPPPRCHARCVCLTRR